jgi:hypothetical protein
MIKDNDKNNTNSYKRNFEDKDIVKSQSDLYNEVVFLLTVEGLIEFLSKGFMF